MSGTFQQFNQIFKFLFSKNKNEKLHIIINIA